MTYTKDNTAKLQTIIAEGKAIVESLEASKRELQRRAREENAADLQYEEAQSQLREFYFGNCTSLTMTLEQAQSASHQGACDADVKALSEVPAIAAQLATFDPAEVAQDLREYGAWSTDELADHDQNLQRLLWLAAGNIREEDATAQR